MAAPHIGVRRGADCFAESYQALHDGSTTDLFVILGIAHAGTRQPFTLTAKPFETPLGTVGKDNEFIDGLVSHIGGERLLMGEFAHKREHSIEFQTLFLRYVMADRPIRIVPILCGSFYPYLITETPPTDDQQIAEFISTLR